LKNDSKTQILNKGRSTIQYGTGLGALKQDGSNKISEEKDRSWSYSSSCTLSVSSLMSPDDADDNDADEEVDDDSNNGNPSIID
jgi:hypothetical protein